MSHAHVWWSLFLAARIWCSRLCCVLVSDVGGGCVIALGTHTLCGLMIAAWSCLVITLAPYSCLTIMLVVWSCSVLTLAPRSCLVLTLAPRSCLVLTLASWLCLVLTIAVRSRDLICARLVIGARACCVLLPGTHTDMHSCLVLVFAVCSSLMITIDVWSFWWSPLLFAHA